MNQIPGPDLTYPYAVLTPNGWYRVFTSADELSRSVVCPHPPSLTAARDGACYRCLTRPLAGTQEEWGAWLRGLRQ